MFHHKIILEPAHHEKLDRIVVDLATGHLPIVTIPSRVSIPGRKKQFSDLGFDAAKLFFAKSQVFANLPLGLGEYVEPAHRFAFLGTQGPKNPLERGDAGGFGIVGRGFPH
jgi:hypothetical protein